MSSKDIMSFSTKPSLRTSGTGSQRRADEYCIRNLVRGSIGNSGVGRVFNTPDDFRIVKSIHLWTSKRVSCVLVRPVPVPTTFLRMGVMRHYLGFGPVRRGYKSKAANYPGFWGMRLPAVLCVPMNASGCLVFQVCLYREDTELKLLNISG